jgi:hypothetical protein
MTDHPENNWIGLAPCVWQSQGGGLDLGLLAGQTGKSDPFSVYFFLIYRVEGWGISIPHQILSIKSKYKITI